MSRNVEGIKMHQLDAEDSREKAAALSETTDISMSDMDVTDLEALKKRGHMQMAAGQYESAINAYSLALKVAQESREEAKLLSNRSEAFASLCQRLRKIPAAQSEAHALYGLDPFTLAQLSLKDAQRAVSMQPKWAKAHLQQGMACFLLERYEEAQAALLEGLSLDPSSHQLQQALRTVREALATSTSAPLGHDQPASTSLTSRRLGRRCDETECILCMKLLFEPVTTPCGHTFCRACFARTTDHSNKCPMCRTVVHVGRQLPVTVTLANLLEKSFPEEYEARRRETRSATGGGLESPGEAPLPLFVMSCMMPGEKMALNIFEPRYRLMVRRCMEGARRFGMATVGPSHELHSVACECEITECQPQPDGRFYLEVVGRRRFRIARAWEQDGYRVAQPRYFVDDSVAPDSPESAELLQLAAAVEASADTWVDKVKVYARGRRGIRVLELLQRAGDKPASGDAERLSFWVANLLPMDTEDRVRLLGITSTRERLQHEKDLLERTASGGGCMVM